MEVSLQCCFATFCECFGIVFAYMFGVQFGDDEENPNRTLLSILQCSQGTEAKIVPKYKLAGFPYINRWPPYRPKLLNPCYRDSQKGAPNFGNHP